MPTEIDRRYFLVLLEISNTDSAQLPPFGSFPSKLGSQSVRSNTGHVARRNIEQKRRNPPWTEREESIELCFEEGGGLGPLSRLDDIPVEIRVPAVRVVEQLFAAVSPGRAGRKRPA